MDKRTVSEINHFKRVMISMTDIGYAADLSAEILATPVDGILRRALEEALVVSYSRPFSDNDSGKLRSKFLKYFNSDQKKIHHRVSVSLRNQIVAHSDAEAYGVKIKIYESGEMKWVLPRQRRITGLLTNNDLKVLNDNCHIIRDWLFKEQSRLKEQLPCGEY